MGVSLAAFFGAAVGVVALIAALVVGFLVLMAFAEGFKH